MYIHKKYVFCKFIYFICLYSLYIFVYFVYFVYLYILYIHDVTKQIPEHTHCNMLLGPTQCAERIRRNHLSP